MELPRVSWWTYIIVLPWLAGVFVTAQIGLRSADIYKRELRATGRITAYEVRNHNQHRYEFTVDGEEFAGLDGAGEPKPAVGDSVEVFYDPRNPNENALASFELDAVRNFGAAFGIFALTCVAIFWLEYARRKWRAADKETVREIVHVGAE